MGLWAKEPVAVGAALRAVLLAFVAFGVQLKPEQIAAVMLAAEAVLGLFTRATVFSPETVKQQLADVSAANTKAGV